MELTGLKWGEKKLARLKINVCAGNLEPVLNKLNMFFFFSLPISEGLFASLSLRGESTHSHQTTSHDPPALISHELSVLSFMPKASLWST